MKLFGLLLITTIFSCHHEKIKVFKRFFNDGKIATANIYDNASDTLNYIEEGYYNTGKLFRRGKYVNGKKDGLWEWWFENGKKSDEATLQQGIYVGQRKHWFPNGKLKQLEVITGECFGDCCNGQVINYYENGQVEDESTNLNGQQHGKYIFRYDNGQPKKKSILRMDLKKVATMNGTRTGKGGC